MAAVRTLLKAPFTPATMSKQHSTLLPKTATSNKFIAKFRSFEKSKGIEHVQFASILSKGGNFTTNSFDIVAVFGNKVKYCFDRVERCFDIVAGVDGA